MSTPLPPAGPSRPGVAPTAPGFPAKQAVGGSVPARAPGLSSPPRPSTAKAPVAGQAKSPQKKPAFSSKKPDTLHGSRDFLFKLLDDCGANEVSDLHVHPGVGMWRLSSGRLKKFANPETDIITEQEILRWMEHADGYEDMKVDDPEKLFGEKGHTTVAFDTGTWRVRGSFRRSTVGISCTFRLIPSKIPTVEDVYLPDVMIDMINRKSGLIIIEGPTGSGKTTSIAALIDYINTNRNLHIYSIEDPIEFHHKPKDATVFTMREIGVHASDYPSAVENALRSKPNVIFIGEMLSNETKKAALHAATTGHLVITTAHAGSVTEAIDSFIGGFNADEQPQVRGRLAQSLLGVMCQSLVENTEGNLVAAREVMLSNLNFSEIIQEGKMQMLHAQMASSPSCFTLEDSLVDLVRKETITAGVAMEQAKRPEVVKAELERFGFM